MADVIRSIRSSGGDYATAALWEAAIPSNTTDRWIGEIDEDFDAGVVTINVSNSNNQQHTLRGGSSNDFLNAAEWDVDTGIDLTQMRTDLDFAHIRSTGTAALVTVATNDIVLERLAVFSEGTSTTAAAYCVRVEAAGDDLTIRYCLLYRDVGPNNANGYIVGRFAGGDGTVLHDSVLWSSTGTSIRAGTNAAGSPASFDVGHCTFLSTGNWGIIGTNEMTLWNNVCLLTGQTDLINSTSGVGGDFNVTDGAASGNPGANSWINQTPADVIEDTSLASLDPRVKGLAAATYQGSDQSSLFGSVDIAGRTRSNFIAGAFETEPEIPPTDVEAQSIGSADVAGSLGGVGALAGAAVGSGEPSAQASAAGALAAAATGSAEGDTVAAATAPLIAGTTGGADVAATASGTAGLGSRSGGSADVTVALVGDGALIAAAEGSGVAEGLIVALAPVSARSEGVAETSALIGGNGGLASRSSGTALVSAAASGSGSLSVGEVAAGLASATLLGAASISSATTGSGDTAATASGVGSVAAASTGSGDSVALLGSRQRAALNWIVSARAATSVSSGATLSASSSAALDVQT